MQVIIKKLIFNSMAIALVSSFSLSAINKKKPKSFPLSTQKRDVLFAKSDDPINFLIQQKRWYRTIVQGLEKITLPQDGILGNILIESCIDVVMKCHKQRDSNGAWLTQETYKNILKITDQEFGLREQKVPPFLKYDQAKKFLDEIIKTFGYYVPLKEFQTLKTWYPVVAKKWITFQAFWAEK